MLARSTFCLRASASSRSSGPSKPSTSTTSAGSSGPRSGDRSASKFVGVMIGIHAPVASRRSSRRTLRAPRRHRTAPAAPCARQRRIGPLARPRRQARGAARRPRASRRACRCNEARHRSRPRAPRARARRSCRTAPPWKCRRSSAGHRTRSNPRITSRTIVTEVVAGASGSMAVNTTCAVIPIGRSASGRKAAKSVTPASRGRRRPPAARGGCRRWRGHGRG